VRFFLLVLGFLIAHRLNAQTIEGKIISVDIAQSTAQFQTNKDLKTIQLLPGDVTINWSQKIVKCTLVKNQDAVCADLVFPADPEELRQVAEVTDALRRDTVERGRIVLRGANDLMPPLALWNQNGKLLFKKDFLGHPVAINFIFTRCRNALMCPASTQCMKRLADELDKYPELKNVKLISVSFDPQNDSPGILNTYAAGYGINSTRHHFLTGDANQIKDLMRQYGILTTQSDGTIIHNAALLVVSPEGRIIHRREGAQFDPVDVADYFLKLNQVPHSK
jgi:cytochrome oxidase Cu insertion factor (SCO1/SenC/PrrC family)